MVCKTTAVSGPPPTDMARKQGASLQDMDKGIAPSFHLAVIVLSRTANHLANNLWVKTIARHAKEFTPYAGFERSEDPKRGVCD